MSESETYGASSFFGFLGVSMALVLASTSTLMQTWEQHTEQPRLVPASAASLFGDLQW